MKGKYLGTAIAVTILFIIVLYVTLNWKLAYYLGVGKYALVRLSAFVYLVVLWCLSIQHYIRHRTFVTIPLIGALSVLIFFTWRKIIAAF